MITYEEAKKKAMTQRTGLDTALEYKGAWVFYNSKNVTGDNMEVVILKESGRRVTMADYIMSTADNDKPKKIKF